MTLEEKEELFAEDSSYQVKPTGYQQREEAEKGASSLVHHTKPTVTGLDHEKFVSKIILCN